MPVTQIALAHCFADRAIERGLGIQWAAEPPLEMGHPLYFENWLHSNIELERWRATQFSITSDVERYVRVDIETLRGSILVLTDEEVDSLIDDTCRVVEERLLAEAIAERQLREQDLIFFSSSEGKRQLRLSLDRKATQAFLEGSHFRAELLRERRASI